MKVLKRLLSCTDHLYVCATKTEITVFSFQLQNFIKYMILFQKFSTYFMVVAQKRTGSDEAFCSKTTAIKSKISLKLLKRYGIFRSFSTADTEGSYCLIRLLLY